MIGQRERGGEHALEIAAVVGDAGRRLERQLRGFDEIPLAQRQPVDVHLGRGAIDQAFHEVVRLGAAGAAIGAHQGGVGHDAFDIDAEQRRPIDAGEVLAGVERQRARRDAGDIGAQIAVSAEADGEEMAVLVEGEFAVDGLGAAVAVGQETGGALVGPLHRTPKLPRRVQDADVFRIIDVLHAEGAADIGGQHPYVFFRLPERLRQAGVAAGDALRRQLDGEAPRRPVEACNRGARLHGDHGDAGVDDVETGDMGGRSEGGIQRGGVAIVIVERHVVRDVVVELRCAGPGGLLGVRHRRQRVDVDCHGLGRVARLRQRFRHHERDRIAHEANLVGHQRQAVGLQQRRAVAVLERKPAGEGRVVRQVRAGPDAEHAGHCTRGTGVDIADHAMGMGAPDDPGMGLPGELEIIGVPALAADQRIVFLAADRLSDPEFLQCNSVVEGAGIAILHAGVLS